MHNHQPRVDGYLSTHTAGVRILSKDVHYHYATIMLLQVPIMNAAILNKRKPHRRNETIAYIICMCRLLYYRFSREIALFNVGQSCAD